MHAWQIKPGDGLAGLRRVDAAARPVGPTDVVVKIHSAALNYRDLMFARGDYLGIGKEALIPVADGAGEVVETGRDVTRFKPGDRVINTYFPRWIDGPPTPQKVAGSPGAQFDGVLAERFVSDETALVAIPPHLDYDEAATLSCAGITAWNALFVDGGLEPGATVVLLGTGGVSIVALQLAQAAGLRTIVTSSSDAKLERARALGADATINYRATPEWQHEVLRLTDGAGADLVVEVGGRDTLPRSVAATKIGGIVSVIGGLSSFGGPELGLLSLIGGFRRLHGFMVGSRAMLDDVVRLVDAKRIKPVVDRVFGFDEAPQAYAHLQSGQHFGKVVIRVAS
ncbi:NAD(P)-dependent alcohol dehydrogenase [Burkholderia cenocepacia]|jgi:NADPH:quinone reductase-like Zn-dependent oxidoreductase|uniref:zinc-dependent alcohol dehydrogenase family protein n=1 Tax=Burkholderia cenocepacia TaxID=95486 RepID=UPI0004F714DA|nr:NAD(P)-dependent alcohol dehydrogenase [Burkholderia cenocepacia]AIO44097.1 zinc-binding dehydrogenase family protein [Burkholderia cepacia]KGC01788.1 zinc-binding dehydrogenase family protein [Burkholderia cepacia]MCG0576640.1 NAD(P)-dependent alcohol dehydrogenase [Burkholderia cenocepacia]MCW3521823.1 NAD(P)-dependent alcohol dehydrogenase [Burkholderia cenocepacia]MCW3611564.1 NAD(P)-dependent alcohol dehydrogenase [Burkholderia cenocepacia]